MIVILRYFTDLEFPDLWAHYVKVVEVKPILSATSTNNLVFRNILIILTGLKKVH